MSHKRCEHPRIKAWWRHGLFTERDHDRDGDVMVSCAGWDGCCPTLVRVAAADLPADEDALIALLHDRLAAAHPGPFAERISLIPDTG